MKAEGGFTFIELLVVLLIIGITFGFAVIAFGDFGESRRLVFAAEQLVNTIELVQQRAILETNTFGLRIDNKGYQVFKLNSANNWDSMANKGPFKMTSFPKNTQISLSPIKPGALILIAASGDMSAFHLRMGTSKEPTLVSLIGQHNGHLILHSERTK